MEIEIAFATIRTLYKTINSKSDFDIMLMEKGNSYGITKNWKAVIGDREICSETSSGALNGLISLLRTELANMISSSERETIRLKTALKQLDGKEPKTSSNILEN